VAFQKINLTGASLLGIERSRLIGYPFGLVVVPEDYPKFRRHLLQCGQAEDKATVELVLASKREEKIYVQLQSTRVQNDEKALAQAQKLESLGVLAGGIAHDFNNLLVGILGNATLALMELSPESPARKYIQDVEVAAQRTSELANQMLAYSGKGKFVVQPLNLSRLVGEMAHLLETVISKKAVLQYDFAENLSAIEGDATQLRQVVMNLITNASDVLGDKDGVIKISTGIMKPDRDYFSETNPTDGPPEKLHVYLEVCDTGCGMDTTTKARIFDPFFTTKFTGRGLGDDEEIVRNVAKRILEKFGFTVLTAEDGREGIQLFREHADEIVVVLLDLTMPHMDGQETLREMRRLHANVRVILSSGFTEQEAVNRFDDMEIAGFIQKPYQPQKLIKQLRALLGDLRES
jgi:signal transduction histidine kinase